MKKLLPLVAMVTIISSCTITVEPRYHWHEDIVGYYDIDEYSNTFNSHSHYSILIEDKNGHDEVWINNFYGVGVSVFGYIDYDKLIIPNQEVSGYEIEGVGTIFSNRIQMNYSVRDWVGGSPTDFCETTAWYD